MTEPADGPLDRVPDDQPPSQSAVPFVVAVVLVGVLAVVAFVFLRSDDAGELVRPDRLAAVDDDSVEAAASDVPSCWRIHRAQVDFDDDRVFVELVAVARCEGVDDEADTGDVVAEVELPEPIGDRLLVAGVGRTRLPCTGTGSEVRCSAEP